MTDKTLALIGAGLLFFGAFLPIVSLPLVGSVSYFMNGSGDGVIVLMLALAAIVLALAGKVRHVVWPGAAALALLVFTFVGFRSRMAEMRARLDSGLGDGRFRRIAEAAADSVQLQWGWAVMAIGAGLLVYAGIAAWRRPGADRPDGR